MAWIQSLPALNPDGVKALQQINRAAVGYGMPMSLMQMGLPIFQRK